MSEPTIEAICQKAAYEAQSLPNDSGPLSEHSNQFLLNVDLCFAEVKAQSLRNNTTVEKEESNKLLNQLSEISGELNQATIASKELLEQVQSACLEVLEGSKADAVIKQAKTVVGRIDSLFSRGNTDEPETGSVPPSSPQGLGQ